MSIIPEEEIWAEFWRGYSRGPEAWRMYFGVSAKGYPELLITGEKESWLVRRESLFSGKPGIGGRIAEDIRMKPRIEPYGFREIPRCYLKKIVAMIERSVDPVDETKIITDILKQPPTTLDRIRSPSVIQGPLVHSYQPLPLISEEQMELNRKLDIELDKWKRRFHHIR
ncbi:MAG: hypothetical protein ACE5KU_05150 [Nitrososphaerales archaeon]